jgi:hypothetical protein
MMRSSGQYEILRTNAHEENRALCPDTKATKATSGAVFTVCFVALTDDVAR